MHLIREAKPNEFSELGELMVLVYSQLEGFPNPEEIPGYYNVLRNVGDFIKHPKAKLFVAVSDQGVIDGGLVYLEI